ncbi:protease 2 [Variibacter gotjawalensis]|uniref:Protease 2 n=1 Tax=Variibacter gotjawalensis TaxID=1333996 RepID=A0A0S3PZF3_9BRAD|nr:S9 family peptidase [Variibacter gotjawalensis]NIK47105.1 oligopeptidase B [Variibacter gotjawalensis]RZS49007.1 oligopeptidase B [Variibacter gotjawalensis]BAT61267.1 protease 2 [Variibacter gotjawalensis]
MTKAPPKTPPKAAEKPFSQTYHGVTWEDEFAWLKAKNWQDVLRDSATLPPEIREHLTAEHAYAKASLAHTEELQKQLVAEMKGRIKEDDSSVPSRDGPYRYFSRYRTGGQHRLVCRLDDSDQERVLLDGDQLAEGQAFFSLAGVRHSPDHDLVAWASDITGAELFTIRIRDLGRGSDLEEEIKETGGSSVVWTRDSSAFYYGRLDDNHRPSRIFRHRIGTDPATDELIFEEKNAAYFVSLGEMQSGAYAQISAADHDSAESYVLDLEDNDAKPKLIAKRQPKVLYDVEHHPDLNGDNVFVISTNAGDSEDFKIVTAQVDTPAEWRDLIPHRQGTYIVSFIVLQNWLIRLERTDGLPAIVVRNLKGDDEHEIAFDEEAYSLGVGAGYEFDTDTVRFDYSSMTTPNETYDYSLSSRERELRKRQEVPSGHDPKDYTTRRLLAPAVDGETVPVSIIYRNDTPLDGTAPLLLYAYGSYGITIPASFSTNRLSLVDRGFVYAIAHIRGGTDKGWRWYRTGKLLEKRNTFTDFIAAADHLVEKKFTRAGAIAAHGGSAGGLLMGAVANMRPELFGAILADVPFVDALNTMLDDSLPLTPPEFLEWGNPIAGKDAFDYIRDYSPYDNVEAKDYPAILALTGLSDPRVLYWEPAKWVAKLRKHKTDNNLLAFHINMDAGHGGAPGRFDRLNEVALTYAFAIAALGDGLKQA